MKVLLIKKFNCFIIPFLFLISLAVSIKIIRELGYGITYQATPSMPKGFYLIEPAKTIKKGDIVIFRPPKSTLNFLLKHKWIPNSGLLMKHIVAVFGDKVVEQKGTIWINNQKTGPVYKYYAPGKILPNSNFQGVLQPHQYLLMSTRIKRSFDGRYFGPVSGKDIVGKAIPLTGIK